MPAMILAAGIGRRMRPLTLQKPKPMLEIGGKPLIQYHVEHLVQSGITDIIVNHAILGGQIEAYLGDGGRLGARIVYSKEHDTPLETASGIAAALPLLGDKAFLTVNADIWTDFPFQSLFDLPIARSVPVKTGESAHIVLVDNPPHHPRGDFYLWQGRAWNQSDEKLSARLTFSGISVFRPEFFAGCPPANMPLAPLLKQAAEQGRVTASHYQGQWRDIGTPEQFEELRQMMDQE